MEDSFFQTMKLTFELAGVTTLILLFIGIPLGYFLSQTKSKLKPVIETLVSMPLVLPPSVLGFYLLLAFSPKNSFGSWLEETFDLRLVFSFEGLIIASVIFSLPIISTLAAGVVVPMPILVPLSKIRELPKVVALVLYLGI